MLSDPPDKFKVSKCKVVSHGHHVDSITNCHLHSQGYVSVLEHLNYIKDLYVTFDSELKFNLHIDEKVNKAYSVLGLRPIYKNYKCMSTNKIVMSIGYKTLARSHL